VQDSWTEAELAYFAGILDGEGCLSLDTLRPSRAKRVYHNPRLRVANTDEGLILWIQARFPGKVTPVKIRPSGRKQQWMWDLFGPSVETILVAVLPYLVVKREQAELLIEYRRTMLPRGGRLGWQKNEPSLSAQTLTHRDALKNRLTVLNTRGVSS
jgi:hypothetical protein